MFQEVSMGKRWCLAGQLFIATICNWPEVGRAYPAKVAVLIFFQINLYLAILLGDVRLTGIVSWGWNERD
jgi:hypothetical protein